MLCSDCSTGRLFEYRPADTRHPGLHRIAPTTYTYWGQEQEEQEDNEQEEQEDTEQEEQEEKKEKEP